MNFKNLRFDKKGNTAVVTFSSPTSLNILNSLTIDELDEAVNILSRDPDIFNLIITGEGKAFIAGADISELKGMNPGEALRFAERGLDLFRKLETMQKPVIAAVNGYTLGGGMELALSCDIRIASEKAKFGMPETGLGIMPGFGGTQRLPKIVGAAKAKELIFTGEIIDSSEAQRIGIVNRVCPHEKVMEEALGMADKISGKSQTGIRYSKIAVNAGIESSIETGMKVEKSLFGMCFAGPDQKEGMAAFIEKRKANFKNNF